jgi:hypothetical protein
MVFFVVRRNRSRKVEVTAGDISALRLGIGAGHRPFPGRPGPHPPPSSTSSRGSAMSYVTGVPKTSDELSGRREEGVQAGGAAGRCSRHAPPETNRASGSADTPAVPPPFDTPDPLPFAGRSLDEHHGNGGCCSSGRDSSRHSDGRRPPPTPPGAAGPPAAEPQGLPMQPHPNPSVDPRPVHRPVARPPEAQRVTAARE